MTKKKEREEIRAEDVGTLDLSAYKHKDGDCRDCKGSCKGHAVTCSHPPGSRQCDHCTLHDDDETSNQARAAKKQKTRKYSDER